jgi:hypothetical protein
MDYSGKSEGGQGRVSVIHQEVVDPDWEFLFIPHETDWASIQDGTV